MKRVTRSRSAPSLWDAFLCDMYRAATLKPRAVTALDLYIANGAFPGQALAAGRSAGKLYLAHAAHSMVCAELVSTDFVSE